MTPPDFDVTDEATSRVVQMLQALPPPSDKVCFIKSLNKTEEVTRKEAIEILAATPNEVHNVFCRIKFIDLLRKLSNGRLKNAAQPCMRELAAEIRQHDADMPDCTNLKQEDLAAAWKAYTSNGGPKIKCNFFGTTSKFLEDPTSLIVDCQKKQKQLQSLIGAMQQISAQGNQRNIPVPGHSAATNEIVNDAVDQAISEAAQENLENVDIHLHTAPSADPTTQGGQDIQQTQASTQLPTQPEQVMDSTNALMIDQLDEIDKLASTQQVNAQNLQLLNDAGHITAETEAIRLQRKQLQAENLKLMQQNKELQEQALQKEREKMEAAQEMQLNLQKQQAKAQQQAEAQQQAQAQFMQQQKLQQQQASAQQQLLDKQQQIEEAEDTMQDEAPKGFLSMLAEKGGTKQIAQFDFDQPANHNLGGLHKKVEEKRFMPAEKLNAAKIRTESKMSRKKRRAQNASDEGFDDVDDEVEIVNSGPSSSHTIKTRMAEEDFSKIAAIISEAVGGMRNDYDEDMDDIREELDRHSEERLEIKLKVQKNADNIEKQGKKLENLDSLELRMQNLENAPAKTDKNIIDRLQLLEKNFAEIKEARSVGAVEVGPLTLSQIKRAQNDNWRKRKLYLNACNQAMLAGKCRIDIHDPDYYSLIPIGDGQTELRMVEGSIARYIGAFDVLNPIMKPNGKVSCEIRLKTHHQGEQKVAYVKEMVERRYTSLVGRFSINVTVPEGYDCHKSFSDMQQRGIIDGFGTNSNATYKLKLGPSINLLPGCPLQICNLEERFLTKDWLIKLRDRSRWIIYKNGIHEITSEVQDMLQQKKPNQPARGQINTKTRQPAMQFDGTWDRIAVGGQLLTPHKGPNVSIYPSSTPINAAENPFNFRNKASTHPTTSKLGRGKFRAKTSTVIGTIAERSTEEVVKTKPKKIFREAYSHDPRHDPSDSDSEPAPEPVERRYTTKNSCPKKKSQQDAIEELAAKLRDERRNLQRRISPYDEANSADAVQPRRRFRDRRSARK